jgi:hypothetical protein
VVECIGRLEPDTRIDIKLRRGDMVIDRQRISPEEATGFLERWLGVCGKPCYCEGTHLTELKEGLEQHTFSLEYGVYIAGLEHHTFFLKYGVYVGSSLDIQYKEKPFEFATISYSRAHQ